MIEEIMPISKWRKGYMFRDQGRWFEVLSFRTQANASGVWVDAYNFTTNEKKTFYMELSHERRTLYEKLETV